MTLQTPPTSRDAYAGAALDRECEAAARASAGRNEQLNRSGFALGQLVGAGMLDREEVERRLLTAAEMSGYIAKDGRPAALATIRSGMDKGEREPRSLPEERNTSPRTTRAGNVVPLSPASKPAPRVSGVPLPAWTPPNDKGKPKLFAVGREEPDRTAGEIRRHAYRRDGHTVRVKVKTGPTSWLDFYRVRRPDGADGWQGRKPDGFVPAPYVGPADAFDPFDPECVGEDLFWPEGEKDVDSLQALGLCAFTFGGASDVLDCTDLLRGRNVVVLTDNDAPGAKSGTRKLDVARQSAASVRMVDFPEMPTGADVSDWIAAGGTADALAVRIAARPDALRPAPVIAATPFRWIDPRTIPPRGWIYGRHYIRKFVSCTISPGGIGKSSLAIVEALAIVSGRPLLNVHPAERTNVWYWNGEDPQDELDRRLMGAALDHGLAPTDIDGRLFVDTGRTKPINVAQQTRAGVTIAHPIIAAMKQTIRNNRIGLVIIDPFVSCHAVVENDNGAVNDVATVWAQIADETGCGVELIHHSRKTGGAEVTVEDGRGAVALLAKARSARALNGMTAEQAEEAGVENHRLYFNHYAGKSNLAPPSDDATWVTLKSVDLDNHQGNRPSDQVGVARAWEWPSSLRDCDVQDLRKVQDRVRDGRFREDPRAADWVGYVVAEVLGLDASDAGAKKRISKILVTWTKARMFKVVATPDEHRKVRKWVEVDQWAT